MLRRDVVRRALVGRASHRSFLRRAVVSTAAVFLATAAGAATAPQLGPRQVGEEVALTTSNPAVRVAGGRDATPVLVWSEVLQFPGATYIAPHFSRFSLPPGAHLVVRDPMGKRQWTYAGKGKPETRGRFWGIHVSGDTAVLELWSRRDLPAQAVVVDRFARGYDEWELPAEPRLDTKTICGGDDSQWAKCYQSSEATAYAKSRAVARLLINGTSACTGWLVGSEGHVMTNEHCIGNATAAANTNFEFMAEGTTCSTSCSSWGACAGAVAATSWTVVKINAALDYALVRLPTNPTATYGYLQMRNGGATLGERIYIPQHPAHWGKKIALTAGTGNATVTSLSQPPCSGSGYDDVGYMADTQGGSSGSPVIGYSDHAVVALHHCADCPNRAVPIQRILADLGTSVPLGATTGGGGGGGGGGVGALQNGVPVSGLSASTGTQRIWTLAVPPGASNLSLSIAGGAGDADLHVQRGSPPTTSSYDCRPYRSGNAETCAFASPAAGTWYVMIHAYASYSGATLTGSYGTGGTNTPPSASFTFTTSGLTVSFTDTSRDAGGAIAGRRWSFGDGTSSTARNPRKTYAAAGTYDVALTVTDSGGLTASTTREVAVTASPGCAGTLYGGSLTAGGAAYQPATSYYQSTVSGTHGGVLDGPAGADFDLYLQRWNGSRWATVASGSTATPDESIGYSGTAGYYRWRVHAYSGAGGYSLCARRP